jgi:PDZ domain-containing secreted protein
MAPQPGKSVSWRPPLWGVLVALIVALTITAVILSAMPSGKIALLPHDPIALNGKLRIDGKSPEPLNGRLFLVGVEEKPVGMLQSWLLSIDPKVTMEPETDARNRAAQQVHDKEAIKASKEVAAAVAFELLGEPATIRGSGAYDTGVAPGTPGEQFFKFGDRIVRLNDRPVATAADITRMIGSVKPGTTFKFGVRRDEQPLLITAQTVDPAPGDTIHKSRIGLGLNTANLKIELPREVSIETNDVIGESAGLAFALDIWDSLSPFNLLRGRYIVATGAVSLDGTVSAIGAARQKAISAQTAGRDLIVVPVGNTDEAVKAIQDTCEEGDDCTGVLAVTSVQEAIEFLRLSDAELASKLKN